MQRSGHHESGKSILRISYTDLFCHSFGHYGAEIRSECKVASLVELIIIQPRPFAVDMTTTHGTAEHEHDVRVTVIRAAVAVLARGASELAHGNDHCVVGKIAEVIPEGGDGLRQIAQHVVELRSLVDVVVPAADVGERHFYTEVSLDQLRKLAKAVAQSAARILRVRSWRVLCRVSRFEHLHGVESFVRGTVKD